MNARQLALRTAVYARDYAAIEALVAGGATSGDLLHAVLRDIARDGNAKLFEILICAAPSGFDLDLAKAIERNVRSGKAGFADGEVLAMHIRAAFLRKILLDQILEDNRMRLELAFESSAAIVGLAGLELSERSIEVQKRIKSGELSFDKAVRVILDGLSA